MSLTSTLNIEWPWLLCLLPLPLVTYWLLPAVAPTAQAALKVPFFSRLARLVQERRQVVSHSVWYWLWVGLIWALLVLAASNPLWLGAPMPIEQSGRDILLMLDLSPSMENPDMLQGLSRATRLSVVKKTAGEFIEGRKGDRLGLVVFGEQAYLLTPLTTDHQTLKQMLDDATAGLAGERTAIGDAIGLGIKRLMPHPKNSRVLILLTDGANNAGNIDPIAAAREAAKLSIKIYTVGLGANEVIVHDAFGGHRVNPSDNLDEESLQKIADITGGQYFRATDPASLSKALQEMDKLEPALNEKATYRPQTPLCPWILLVALLFSLPLLRSRLNFSFMGARA